jgi:hypothetical protein
VRTTSRDGLIKSVRSIAGAQRFEKRRFFFLAGQVGVEMAVSRLAALKLSS